MGSAVGSTPYIVKNGGQQVEKLEGVVEHIVYTNPENGYTVCLLDCGNGEPVTAVGLLPSTVEDLTHYRKLIIKNRTNLNKNQIFCQKVRLLPLKQSIYCKIFIIFRFTKLLIDDRMTMFVKSVNYFTNPNRLIKIIYRRWISLWLENSNPWTVTTQLLTFPMLSQK